MQIISLIFFMVFVVKLNWPVASNTLTDKYFIFTPGCQIRSWPVEGEGVKKLYKKYKIDCKLTEQIVDSYYNENTEKYYLRYLKPGYDCRYCPAVRDSNKERSVKVLTCKDFNNNFEVPVAVDQVIIDCKKQSTTVKDAIAFIQKRKFGKTRNLPSTSMPSVLILGIDSLSKINFRRTMPKSFEFLNDKERGFIELLGYNKVEDNTFPNLMAVLTGQDLQSVRRNCQMKNLNNCHFIWESFKDLGYITGFAEDSERKATFVYDYKGFKESPFDFDIHPLTIAMEKNMKMKKLYSEETCIGHKFYADYIFDYALDFVKRYNDTPTFGFFWTNTFSHSFFDTAAIYDSHFRDYLEKFEKAGVFNNTIVIVMSDHGFRYGDILNLQGGFLETRLPFFFIRLPEGFQKEYPTIAEAISLNSKRLSSNYDIHHTLKHIIHLYKPTAKLPVTVGCKHCQSIFKEIPENRTCSGAGIVQSYCTCNEYFDVRQINAKIFEITRGTIRAMNDFLFETHKNLTEDCSRLSLNKILSAKKKFERLKQITYTFSLEYVVKPFNAIFQAIVEYNTKLKTVNVNVEEIGRQDSYEKTAKCVEDKILKKYCICKNSEF